MARLAGVVGQWLAAAALYLGFAGSTDKPELIAAAATAALTVGCGFWGRQARAVVMRTRPSWLGTLPRLLRTLGIEAVLVGRALVPVLLGRRSHGTMLSQPFDPGRQPAGAAGRRAGKVLAASAVAVSVLMGFVLWSRHGRAMLTRIRTSWLRIAPRVVRALGTDAGAAGGVLLAVLLGSPRQAETLSKPSDPDAPSAAAAGRRALAMLAASAAPDGYVVALKDDEDSLLLHRLVPRQPSPDRHWPI